MMPSRNQKRNTRKEYRDGRKTMETLEELNLSDATEAGHSSSPPPPTSDTPPTSFTANDTPASTIFPQMPIPPKLLPTVISCFLSEHLMTRELMFNFGRIPTIAAVKTLVDKYFAWEFLRLKLPTTVKFLGLNCYYPNKPSDPDGDEYFTISTEPEYGQWYDQILAEKAFTGQIVRIQVCLMTEEMISKGKKVTDWYDKDPAHEISGPEWKLAEAERQQDKYAAGIILIDSRIFEVNPNHNQVIAIPAHAWREADEKANQYEKLDNLFNKLLKDKKTERQKVKTELSDQADEIRGLKAILRANKIRFTSKDVEDPELYNRVVEKNPRDDRYKLTAEQAVAIEEGRKARARFEKGESLAEEVVDNAKDLEMQERLEKLYADRGDEFHEAWHV